MIDFDLTSLYIKGIMSKLGLQGEECFNMIVSYRKTEQKREVIRYLVEI